MEAMGTAAQKSCRKCGTPNPEDNVYCRKCGALLDISTREIEAQPKPVMPEEEGIRWRYVGVGIFVLLGLTVCFLGAAAYVGFRMNLGQSGLTGLVADFFTFLTVMGVLFLLAFGIGGVVMGWISSRAVTKEVMIAAVVVIGLLGAAGAALTDDLLIVAAILLLPSMGAAWLGTKSRRRGARSGVIR